MPCQLAAAAFHPTLPSDGEINDIQFNFSPLRKRSQLERQEDMVLRSSWRERAPETTQVSAKRRILLRRSLIQIEKEEEQEQSPSTRGIIDVAILDMIRKKALDPGHSRRRMVHLKQLNHLTGMGNYIESFRKVSKLAPV